MFTLVLGVIIYFSTKRYESRLMKREMAQIMCSDIGRILKIESDEIRLEISSYEIPVYEDIAPSENLYQSLLNSENIRFFSTLQRDFEICYYQIRINPLNPDRKLCKSIYRDLLDMKKQNKFWYFCIIHSIRKKLKRNTNYQIN